MRCASLQLASLLLRPAFHRVPASRAEAPLRAAGSCAGARRRLLRPCRVIPAHPCSSAHTAPPRTRCSTRALASAAPSPAPYVRAPTEPPCIAGFPRLAHSHAPPRVLAPPGPAPTPAKPLARVPSTAPPAPSARAPPNTCPHRQLPCAIACMLALPARRRAGLPAAAAALLHANVASATHRASCVVASPAWSAPTRSALPAVRSHAWLPPCARSASAPPEPPRRLACLPRRPLAPRSASACVGRSPAQRAWRRLGLLASRASRASHEPPLHPRAPPASGPPAELQPRRRPAARVPRLSRCRPRAWAAAVRPASRPSRPRAPRCVPAPGPLAAGGAACSRAGPKK
jgi:hypothetical protein